MLLPSHHLGTVNGLCLTHDAYSFLCIVQMVQLNPAWVVIVIISGIRHVATYINKLSLA